MRRVSTQHKQKIKGKEDAEMKAEIKEKMQEMLDAAVANKELAGGSMLIRQGGEEICYLESGMADKETVIQLNQAMKDIVNRTGTV